MNTLESQNLLNNVANLIEDARRKVQTSVNSAMVHTYFLIGKHIVEYEQHGHERATYGKSVLKDLSNGLTERFGNGLVCREFNTHAQILFDIFRFRKQCLRNSQNSSNHLG